MCVCVNIYVLVCAREPMCVCGVHAYLDEPVEEGPCGYDLLHVEEGVYVCVCVCCARIPPGRTRRGRVLRR